METKTFFFSIGPSPPLLNCLRPVIIAEAASVDKLRAGLGRLVVPEPRVVALARTGHDGQGASIATHRVHADFGAAKIVLFKKSFKLVVTTIVTKIVTKIVLF